MADLKDTNNIITIDCNYIYPRFACAYLIIENGRAAFIENNTRFAVPLLISALKENGLGPEDVDFIIITHVHLDHAGGTSALSAECPNAAVIAHERAARHIINPEKLIKGSIAVYGEEKFRALYGSLDPVDEKRVRIAADGETIKFGAREFQFIYTSGHAKHHMCVYEKSMNGIFTGDSFGLAYPALQNGKAPFIFPSTTPSDFNAGDARRSVDKIVQTGAEVLYLTHFGRFSAAQHGAEMLVYFLNKIEDIQKNALNSNLQGNDLDNYCLEKMRRLFYSEAEKSGIQLDRESGGILEADIVLNAQGVAFAVRKEQNG